MYHIIEKLEFLQELIIMIYDLIILDIDMVVLEEKYTTTVINEIYSYTTNIISNFMLYK